MLAIYRISGCGVPDRGDPETDIPVQGSVGAGGASR
jgi:hypothetical protein